MAGRKKAPMWRQAFLRALKRTGNVRASAVEAGVDAGTAYDHRAKDAGFREGWAGALQAFKAVGRGKGAPRLRSGRTVGREELVLRRTKHGDRLVRAAAGRWCARVEERFLDGLEQTGCVRTAARAAGISTAALYERRDHYPEFRTRWDERVARFGEQLPGLLNAAAVRGLSPQPEGAKRRGRARLPAMNMDQSIRLLAINQNAKARGGGRGGERPPEPSREALIEALTALYDMVDRRVGKQRLADGWTDAGNGVWVPPGWVRRPDAAGDEGDRQH